MRVLTFALTQAATARAALAALAGGATRGGPDVEALVELLARPHAAPLAPIAVTLLADSDHPLAVDALVAALDSPLVTVRLPAIEALARRCLHYAAGRLVRLLQEDDSWLVRRAVVRALAENPEPQRWHMLLAADDPHWRVRHALLGILLPWGQNSEQREDIDRRLAQLPVHPRIEGVRGYLQARWNCPLADPADEWTPPSWPFYDPDPAVLVQKLEQMGEAGRRRHRDAMPALLSHEADRARSLAIETLRRRGETVHLAAAVAQLDDLRAGAGEAVQQLLRGIDLDRIEDAARYLLHRDDATPAQLAWAIDQAGPTFPPDEEQAVLRAYLRATQRLPSRVRLALARLAGRWLDGEAGNCLVEFLNDPDPSVLIAVLQGFGQHNQSLPASTPTQFFASLEPEVRIALVHALAARGDTAVLQRAATDPDARVRIALAEELVKTDPGSLVLCDLQADPHPLVRAAALTAEHAAALIADPERESSWHVLECAARMQKVPFWSLEPQPPWQPPERVTVPVSPLTVHPAPPSAARSLGPAKLAVAPIGISGHYGLPVEGFVKAVEAGVNLLFWEPNYQTLTTFAGRLSPGQRRELHFLAGTFEASGSRIRKDAERVVRNLGIDRIALFLIFWTRSWERVTDEVRGTLERLQQDGLIGMAGLSTHFRPLAVEALTEGWNPVMVRHSAAHRGAETHVFPHVSPSGASIITFNNTCYGRLLKPQADRPPPPAADCYRFTLSFPEVTMCLSAPATMEQLDENLAALRDPRLPEERRRLLLEQGAEVYREETLFRRLVRSR